MPIFATDTRKMASDARTTAAPPARVVALAGVSNQLVLRRMGVPKQKCDPAMGPRNQPAHVSDKLIKRITGAYAAIDGDPGGGCIKTPYPAGNGETVCTIGYGHQMRDCPTLSRATGAAPTQAEVADANTAKVREPDNPKAKARRLRPSEWLTCACAGKAISCGPDSEAAAFLTRDVQNSGEYWVHNHVQPDLDQDKFDALVDLVLHHGSIDKPLLDAINSYYCTPEGWNYIRELYLQADLTPQGDTKPLRAFAERRQRRAWPPAQVAPDTSQTSQAPGPLD